MIQIKMNAECTIVKKLSYREPMLKSVSILIASGLVTLRLVMSVRVAKRRERVNERCPVGALSVSRVNDFQA